MINSPVQEVRRAKARYCRFIDTHQWDEFSALLAPDIRVRMFNPAGQLIVSVDNREVFLAVTRPFLDGACSSHQVHNEEIDMVSDDEIVATWAMEDLVITADPRPGQPTRLHGYGHYHETWSRTAEGWRIAQLELRRTILEIS